ncbi:DNA-binding protein MNB1B [Zea mays]|uniref:DNA-binding protein MNB1B n=2 Tax=Zea mays TaxID=4577 RepID=C0PBU8_MAIZE|nr:unknown [Zea mays]AQK67325.1 DNA-binding protein MNB1B [Zea mays]AQK67328.1 DNA-binding protein MNB1B [Zea mays]
MKRSLTSPSRRSMTRMMKRVVRRMKMMTSDGAPRDNGPCFIQQWSGYTRPRGDHKKGAYIHVLELFSFTPHRDVLFLLLSCYNG